MYQVGDKIVHPMHGAGIVDEIVERTIDGQTETYYALRLVLERVVLYIPVRTSGALGVRPVCSAEAAQELLGRLPALEIEADGNWNRRYRENMDRLRSGDLLEVAGVVKGLTLRDRRRGLSTGEKKMLGLAKQILASELSLALGRDPEEMKAEAVELLCPR
ncbi:MAG: CarD family transcriptional regulator [Clostridiaceae bacterium]|nr:CarD family transcriptional regulator [Clostridiaceae bacterium]MCI9485225.1 CarD family transcriptional regulator [Clostridiaceae bacterium]NBH78159.1 CarD family transcriptional regulator [Clostridiaceae bacterium]NBI83131.1 CarD family transcriptional regulator [Clostridiaceae bacterium]RKJ75846.1 CarD family transcriptional regulator [Butyricicoccus sp. 1XD8-22]